MTAVSGEFSKSLTDLAAKTVQYGNIGTSTFGRVASVVGGNFVSGVEGWVAALKRGESGSKDLAKVYDSLKGITGETRESIALMARSGDEGAKEIMGMLGALDKMGDQTDKLDTQLKKSEKTLADEIKQRNDNQTKEQRLTTMVLNAQNAWLKIAGKLQAALIEKLAPAIIEMANRIDPLIDEYLPAFIKVVKFAIDHLEWFVGAWVAFRAVGFFKSLMNLAGGVGTVAPFFIRMGAILGSLVTTILPIVGTALSAIGTALAAVTLPVWGVVAAVVAVGAAIWYFWDDLVDITKGIGSWLGNLWSSTVDAISKIDWMGLFADAFKGLFNVLTFIPRMLAKGVMSLFGGIGEMAGDAFSEFFGSSKSTANTKTTGTTTGAIGNVNTETVKTTTGTTSLTRQGTTTNRTAGDNATADPIQQLIGLLQQSLDVNQSMLKELTSLNDHSSTAHAQRNMQIHEQRKMQRNHSMGMTEAN